MKPDLLPMTALVAYLASTPCAIADYPIVSHRYLADPGAMVYDGRVYLYCSNDDENPTGGGYSMKSIVCVSSNDLKNWTDHGVVFRVPADAAWASYAWAPAVVARNNAFYLYFGNSGSGIGVASSSSPTGPFTDAKGGYLIDAGTPGVLPASSIWIFDPAVFIDEDGQAYLYFGGNGEGNVRVIRLNEDMVSTSGSAVALTVPYFFEAAWMHKRDGLYYFSYSTNPPTGCGSTTSPATVRSEASPTAASLRASRRDNNNNNHAAIFEFNGAWYHAYHNRIRRHAGGHSDHLPAQPRHRAPRVQRRRYDPAGDVHDRRRGPGRPCRSLRSRRGRDHQCAIRHRDGALQRRGDGRQRD